MVFACSQCGDCCSSITIRIESQKAEVLQGQPWVQERLAHFGKTLYPQDGDYWLIPHQPDKTCVFLSTEKICMIELHEGKALKPAECIHFPFAAVKTPTGVRYDCSASCKHVAENLLSEFSPIMPDPALAAFLPEQPAPERVAVTPFQSISWAELSIRQEKLAPVFQSNALPIDALRTAKKILSSNNGFSPSGLAKTRPLAGFYQWALLLFFIRKPYGTLSWVQCLTGKGYCDPYVFGQIPLPSLRAEKSRQWTTAAISSVNAYLYNLLQRYVLYSHGHQVSNLLSIALVGHCLLDWHARVLAECRDAQSDYIIVEDVQAAIRIVERYYTGHQPRFLAFFRQSALLLPGMNLPLGWLIDRLCL